MKIIVSRILQSLSFLLFVLPFTGRAGIDIDSLSSYFFCPGDTGFIHYSSDTTFGSGNMMSVQLSDELGDFGNSLVIGSLSTTDSTGTITVVIPLFIPAGTAYRMRVTSDTPFVTGNGNDSDLVIFPIPETIITPDGPTSFCPGGSVTLSVSENDTYLWSNGETTQDITVSTTDYYTVTVTDTNGCSAESGAQYVEQYEVDHPFFQANQTLFTSHPYNVEFTNLTLSLTMNTFLWEFGDGDTSTSDSILVPHTYLNDGLYSVTLYTTSILNGCMDSATYTDYIDCSDITGISGLSSGTVFHAFPNPGNGIFSIRVPETGEGFFTLSDISGKVIRILPSHRGNPFTLDIRNLQPGIFFLRDESSGMTLRLISNP